MGEICINFGSVYIWRCEAAIHHQYILELHITVHAMTLQQFVNKNNQRETDTTFKYFSSVPSRRDKINFVMDFQVWL